MRALRIFVKSNACEAMRALYLSVFFGLFSFFSFAAEIEVPGTVIRKTGERLHGTLWVRYHAWDSTLNFYLLQPGVKFVSYDGTRVDLNPKHIAEYNFEWRGQEIRMLSSDCKLKKHYGKRWRNVFIHLIMDGRMQVLNYWHGESNLSPDRAAVHYGLYSAGNLQEEVLKRPGEQGIKSSLLRRPRKRAAYFADCPDLYKMVEAEDIHFGESKQIARYYNEHCK
jgi:hypothetical protein